MKSLLVIVFLSVCAIGQETSRITIECPDISVEAPARPLKKGEKGEFRAVVKYKPGTGSLMFPRFRWYISHGKITKGQGTDKITVVQGNSDANITVTVDISGLPSGCLDTASATTVTIISDPYDVIDEYGKVRWLDEQQAIARVAKFMQDNPDVAAFWCLGGRSKKLRDKTHQRKIAAELRSLKSDYYNGRVYFGVNDDPKALTRIYSVPPAALLPRCGKK